ncbi:39S ribosomal protein L10, mitochondrial-like [Acropora millepora]|uniref:39S ribosomal protein L10, mitochondrial-like n=1 Tax=Acropora millepora TaxID=45264 RepID=UPI001CF13258|nr:39S ribosomal protein L10, mitochondrial-like [Acropora millepora]
MALTGVGVRTTNCLIFPCVISSARFRLVRSISKMAASCKAGRNKRREVKPSARKLMIADEVRNVFASNEMVLVCQFGDLKTEEWEELRFTLNKEDIAVKMFPNRVTAKALEDTKYREVTPLFLAPTFVTFSKEAKVKPLLSAIKQQPKIELLGGKIDNHLLSRNSVVDYSKLPSLTELQGQLLQILSEPSRRLATLLGQNQSNLSMNLSQYVSQGEDKS